MDDKLKINRREFIKGVSLTGLSLAAGPTLLANGKASAQVGMSKIVISEHPDAATGVRVNTEPARKMVDIGVMHFTGQTTVADAWASLLPGLAPDHIVSIKVNCINSGLPTHPQVVDAITSGLIAAGVKDNNIIIWDRTKNELINCGYNYNSGNSGVRCFGTNENGWGSEKQVTLAGRTVKLSKILTSSDHIINAPVLKDHSIAGVTLSMKNHYGSINSPNILHGNSCDPYIAELNNIPEIKEKTRLIILDGIMGIYKGGPMGGPQFLYNGILISQDPVALDYQGWNILKTERVNHGMNLPLPKYIDTAADLGLGTNNPDNIDLSLISAKEQAVKAQGKMATKWAEIRNNK